MPLTADYRNVKDWETVCVKEDGNVTSLCHAISLLSMSCGYSEITEKNWEKVFTRIFAVERVLGAMRLGFGNVPTYFTPQDVKKMIGFRINVTPTTDAAFRKVLWEMMQDKAFVALRKAEVDG